MVPAAVADTAIVPPPINTPLLVKLEVPVPPYCTPTAPELIRAAECGGKSLPDRVVAAVTRPLVSTVTLVNSPPTASVVLNVGFGKVPVKSPPALPDSAPLDIQLKLPEPSVLSS